MQVFSYCIEGRNKPLYFSHFLELLPTLSRCLFAERSSPKKQGFEAEEEMAMKNLLVLFEKLYHIILEEEIYRRGVVSE